MEIDEYLALMARLYMEGVCSNESTSTLQSFGGVMVLAAKDQKAVHTEEDAILYLDMPRTIAERWTQALTAWKHHEARILEAVRQGKSPAEAVFDHLRKHQASPHTPEQLRTMVQQEWMSDGRIVSAWQAPIIRRREHAQRVTGMLTGSSFGAIATMVALAATAEDFHNATPEEWSRAMDVGDVANLIGKMANQHTKAVKAGVEMHGKAFRPTSTGKAPMHRPAPHR